MVRPSTQQTVDRIVGTAAILGLSIAAIRWLCHASKQRRGRQNQNTLPWWWPIIALRRRSDRRARSHGEGGGELEQSRAREKNMESGYEHRGSCHCRSIQFLVSNIGAESSVLGCSRLHLFNLYTQHTENASHCFRCLIIDSPFALILQYDINHLFPLMFIGKQLNLTIQILSKIAAWSSELASHRLSRQNQVPAHSNNCGSISIIAWRDRHEILLRRRQDRLISCRVNHCVQRGRLQLRER